MSDDRSFVFIKLRKICHFSLNWIIQNICLVFISQTFISHHHCVLSTKVFNFFGFMYVNVILLTKLNKF